ncbi:MAG: hypothetical protein J6M02_00800 [Clostridia bacterium]|nr:hypothetical protein [Clostridia bacterium]
MIKLRDEDKKLLLLIIIIGLVIFTIVFMDLLESLEALSKQNLQDAPLSALEEAVKSINLAPKNESDAFLRQSISKIFELMNNKDFDGLYQLLSPDFKEEIFHSSFEDFEKYMAQYASEEYSPKYTKYEKYGDTYIVNVSFLQYSEDVTQANGSAVKYDYFCIRKMDDGDFTFSLAGFIGNKEPNKTVGNDLFKITLTKSMLTRSSSSFMITLENLSEENVMIPAKQIYTVTGIKPKYYKGSVMIPAKDTAKIQFTVYTGQSLTSALPKDIVFPVKIGEKSYSFSLPVEYCIEI